MVRQGGAYYWALDVASTFSLLACTASPGCLDSSLLCLFATTEFYSQHHNSCLRLYFPTTNLQL
jgi:hypothetical protein